MTGSAGLRTEILVTLSLLLGAALLFGGLVMLRYMETSLLDERLKHLGASTRMISRATAPGGATVGADAGGLGTLIPDDLHCRSWRLYNRDLVLVGRYGTAPAGFNRAPAQFYQSLANGEIHRTVVFPTIFNLFSDSEPVAAFLFPLEGAPGGVLDIAYSLNDIKATLTRSLVLILVYVVFYGAVLLGAGFFLLQRTIIRPAQTLLAATTAVGRGELDRRLPVSGPHELSRLAEAYNHMVEALQKSQTETSRHIASLESANAMLEQTRSELVRREKLASVGQLAAGLAHELGNPLAALIGYLELLKSRLDSADRDLIERSLAETTRIDFLVRELLDFARPDNGRQPDPVDPVAVLGESLNLLRNQGVLAGFEIESRLPAATSAVYINSNKLQQVYVNLLLNAVHACDRDGLITLAGGEEDGHVWVSIGDNGCGIGAADIDRIFEPFYTTKNPGDGTGLGLAMCQRIVEEAGGRIEVASEPGRGSEFRIFFSMQ